KIPIFADIKKKHAAHTLTADLDIADVARGMELHRADGIIVTGTHTGEAPSLTDLEAVAAASDLPLLVGSGTTPENYSTLFPYVDGFIVGSAFKENGQWDAPVCEKRVEKMIAAAEQVRAVHQAELMNN
ncbi:MAG TPA: BtpA/SgcQ family protein, partial [Rhodothermales bacterium]|nr:BtpA/SgcQ family protein [Rhodothermales bacterium]